MSADLPLILAVWTLFAFALGLTIARGIPSSLSEYRDQVGQQGREGEGFQTTHRMLSK